MIRARSKLFSSLKVNFLFGKLSFATDLMIEISSRVYKSESNAANIWLLVHPDTPSNKKSSCIILLAGCYLIPSLSPILDNFTQEGIVVKARLTNSIQSLEK